MDPRADLPREPRVTGHEAGGAVRELSRFRDEARARTGDDASPRVRVLVADDHPMYQEGVSKVLAGCPGVELIESVGLGRDALAAVRRLTPEVALVDLRLPDLDGVAVVEQIEREGLPTRVIIVSAFDDSATVYRSIAAGAAGYLSKVCSAETLCEAIGAVARGETVIPPALQAGLAREIRARRELDDQPLLTPRETEILRLIEEGLSAPEIAEALVVSVTTVKTHLQNIYAKLEVSDRAAAVAQAIRRGLI